MKFSESHFIENERSIYDTIRDAISININSYNYGVLPPFLGQNESLDIQISQRSDQFVQITLNGLNAITAGGMRVNINPKNEKDSIVYTHSFLPTDGSDKAISTEQVFDIVLRVIPGERVLVGEPDPEEIPPRIPYVGPKYVLSVLPSNPDGADSASYLVIGRVVQHGDQFLVDENYIPSCTVLSSHRALIQAYKNFGNRLISLQSSAAKVIAKINLRNQHVTLSDTIGAWCGEILSYIATIQFEYQNMVKEQPPIVMVNCFATLANRLLVRLNSLSTVDKEELLNYFYQWIDVTPGNFGNILTQCAGIAYQHQNIYKSIEPIDHFLDMLDTIWLRLSSLEYIGQRKDNIIITEQTQSRQAGSVKQSWKTID